MTDVNNAVVETVDAATEVVEPVLELQEVEKRHILSTLERFNNNKVKTAQALGVTVKTIYNKLHTYGVFGSPEVK